MPTLLLVGEVLSAPGVLPVSGPPSAVVLFLRKHSAIRIPFALARYLGLLMVPWPANKSPFWRNCGLRWPSRSQ